MPYVYYILLLLLVLHGSSHELITDDDSVFDADPQTKVIQGFYFGYTITLFTFFLILLNVQVTVTILLFLVYWVPILVLIYFSKHFKLLFKDYLMTSVLLTVIVALTSYSF